MNEGLTGLERRDDVNSQVTKVTKTFQRYKELNVLIESIWMFYPEIKMIIADDSLKPEPINERNIEHYALFIFWIVFAKRLFYIYSGLLGWFAGRNLAIVITKYLLWVDDDFVFLKGTRIESFLEIMEAVPELDIVALLELNMPQETQLCIA